MLITFCHINILCLDLCAQLHIMQISYYSDWCELRELFWRRTAALYFEVNDKWILVTAPAFDGSFLPSNVPNSWKTWSHRKRSQSM